MERKIIAVFEIDDTKAIEEDLGTLDYFERESGWLEKSGIRFMDARVIDTDDSEDTAAINSINNIFEGGVI